MTNQEAIEMLTAKAECIRRETSGTDIDCNLRNCDECDLCYKQGTMGDQREALCMAISALQAQEETVSRKVYEQISWERDIAVMQLKDLGYSLGEKIRTVGDTISRQAANTKIKKYRKKPVVIEAYQTDVTLDIETLEGIMHASAGDYIITGVNGEQYPCKPNIFEKTYEEVSDECLPSVQPEPLTDKEQRIFLAAMSREEKVCAEVDRNSTREPYEDSLMSICREIKRKVKGVLWT